ncbi:unnamed protein product [Clonostachys solani]|uniref:Histone deacetylase domain-containing protein n=1 Tax=Clonostachys solani TaxID=160281 RepID=A0A9N9ZB83_9HYPO|nr:unnamed protein product [Clonostachys solani]
MASKSDAPQPSRLETTTINTTTAPAEDNDLARSLEKLSISHEPAPKSPLLEQPKTPLGPSSRRSSQSPAPRRRVPSRSPSAGPNSRMPNPSTPNLHRKASMNSLHSANGVSASYPPLRRSSSNQTLSPTGDAPLPPKAPLTPASIASDCLKAELNTIHGPTPTLSAETVVIVNDAVYGHRFSRPRTSKGVLSTIVERPERIKAAMLGISLAYVRLGERHADGAQALTPKREVQEVSNIPFRIQKTDRKLSILSPAVTNVHGTKWMDELKGMCDMAEGRLAAGGKELQRRPRSRTSTRTADDPTPEKLHEGDLYLCAESLNAFEGALGAVCEGIDTIFNENGPRRAFVGVRPPGHHCSASHPSGFCWVNNVHVGIMHAAMNHGLTHAAIIDFDLHHGDGSQSIAWQHNTRANLATKNAMAWKKSSIGYFSLHDINSYPCEGGDEEKVKNASLCIDNAHGQSIWNVHLEQWDSEQEFWDLYETKYSVLLVKARNYLRNQARRLSKLEQTPKAAIFFSAGFDASEWESAGMQRHTVNVPTGFYARLSRDVVKLASEEGLGVDGRVISVLEGGYSDRALFSGVFSHLCGFAPSCDAKPQTASDGLGIAAPELGLAPRQTSTETEATEHESTSAPPYDSTWWASSSLDVIDSLIAAPPEVPKKPRQPSLSTYSSPTQASVAKVVDPANMRRSLSGLSSKGHTRPVSPPPPEVPWHIAAHELSKLLIPSDRQTDSCKAEDLNAEATRQRQARQSTAPKATPVGTPERPGSKMNLRGRKPRVASSQVSEPVSAKDRRKTLATSTPGAETSTTAVTTESKAAVARRASRRLSGISTIGTGTDEAPPQSSTTTRPDLATSGRSQSSTDLATKKTRAPATPRRTAGNPRTARGAGRAATTAPIDKQVPATEPRKPPTTVDDLDNITRGMKKIKINLITKSQKEARERARLGKANTNAAGPASAAPPLAEALSTEIDMPSSPPISPTTIPAESPVPAITNEWALDRQGPVIIKQEPDFGSEPGLLDHDSKSTTYGTDDSCFLPPHKTPSPDLPQVAIQASSDPADVFIAYQPEGPAPKAAVQSEPLTWLPPNIPTSSANTPVATPMPVRNQNKLFTYKAGGIPFAPRPKHEAPPANEGNHGSG